MQIFNAISAKNLLIQDFISYMAKKIREVRLVRGSLLIVLFSNNKAFDS